MGDGLEVAVLGHRGLLGSAVARYFAEMGASVRTTELRYDGTPTLPKWAGQYELIVNCIRGGWAENAALPFALALAGRTIHPSTDALREDTPYAAQKRKGDEAPNVIIRAGIVDVRRQPEIAYTNWTCNPITPLEWARIAWRLREAKPGVYQYGREPLDRYEISRLVRLLWLLPPPKPARAKEPNNRVIASRANLPPIDVALLEYRQWLRS